MGYDFFKLPSASFRYFLISFSISADIVDSIGFPDSISAAIVGETRPGIASKFVRNVTSISLIFCNTSIRSTSEPCIFSSSVSLLMPWLFVPEFANTLNRVSCCRSCFPAKCFVYTLRFARGRLTRHRWFLFFRHVLPWLFAICQPRFLRLIVFCSLMRPLPCLTIYLKTVYCYLHNYRLDRDWET